MTKKLVVCGCSFSAVSKTLPGSHYSEILAKHLGWELYNLARPGSSNNAIRYQIKQALEQQPDFVIVVPTFPDRIEVPCLVPEDLAHQIGNYNVMSETLSTLVDGEMGVAVKQYINHLYTPGWKQQVDEWVLISGLLELYLVGINFIVVPDLLWGPGSTVHKRVNTIPSKFFVADHQCGVVHATRTWPCGKDGDPGYHGAPESQQYLADAFFKIITNW